MCRGSCGCRSVLQYAYLLAASADRVVIPCALLLMFRCADLDCDGVITPSEMWHFYEEQMKRLEGLSQEPVLFEDVLCQLHDMLQPAREGCYTLADVKRTRPQSSLLFNTMFNLHKFMAYENRDPFALRAEQLGEEGQVLSDWDRFARGEYLRLAVEEEPEDMQVGNTAAAADSMHDQAARGRQWPHPPSSNMFHKRPQTVELRQHLLVIKSATMCSCGLTAHLYMVVLQVDATEEMWGSGRTAAGSKMLLEDAEEDDLVVGLGAAAGAAAEFMGSADAGGATAMDAAS